MKMTAVIAVGAVMILSFGGCGSTTNHLGNTRDANDRGIYYTSGNAAYWDGYGVNNGRGIGDDLRNVGEDMKNSAIHATDNIERSVTGRTATLAN